MKGVLLVAGLLVPLSGLSQSIAELKAMRPYECMTACVEKGHRSKTCADLETCESQCRTLCYPKVEQEEQVDSTWMKLLAPRDDNAPRFRYMTVVTQGPWHGFSAKQRITAIAIDSTAWESEGVDLPEFKSVPHLLSFFGSMGWEYMEATERAGGQIWGETGTQVLRFRQPYFIEAPSSH